MPIRLDPGLRPPRNVLLSIRWPDRVERRDPDAFDVFFRTPRAEARKVPGWRGRVYSAKENERLDYVSSIGRRLILTLDRLPEVARIWPFSLEIPLPDSPPERNVLLCPDLVVALQDGRWAILACRSADGMATREAKTAYAAIRVYAERYGFGYTMTDGEVSVEEHAALPVPAEFRRDLRSAVRLAGRLPRADVERIADLHGATRRHVLAVALGEPMGYHTASGAIDWLGDEAGSAETASAGAEIG
ncbi:MAG: hypothetical protein KBA30_02710 [Clostridia bacterium]|nr:hypothetical protein [Clostridia bacterium]